MIADQRRGCVETGAVSIFAFLVSILLKIEKKTSEIAKLHSVGTFPKVVSMMMR